ncbi:MAG: NitT/TauT family transport system substrate-binding protein [Phycisphaerales bacterium]|nr:NitT/TauT family transport system substrate-binding protein [Phycisphaerales bacterium]
MRQKFLSPGFLCILCASAVSLMGCEKQESSAQNGAQKVTLQLNWKPEPQFGGFYAAKEFASKHNLDLEIFPGGVGKPTVQMVAAGKVPFGIVSADEVVIARSNGADVVALFAVYQTNPQGLMTHAARGFKSIGDIFANPGTVAMQRGLPYAAFLEKKFGFDKVKIVPSPGGDLSAFRNDPNFSMQCFVTSEPIAAKKAGLDVQTFLVAEAGYNPYTTVLVTRGDYRAKNPQIVQSMMTVVGQGWRAYLDDPAKTNALMQQLNPNMDAHTFVAAAEAQKALIETDVIKQSRLGVMTLERWDTLCKQLIDLKVVEKAPTASECFVSN